MADAHGRISSNSKISAIVDDEAEGGPLAPFESGAILTYLADKTGLLLPASGPARYTVLEWLYWSIGGLGPMLGQLNFYALQSDETAPLAIKRFTREPERLIGVMDWRLSESAYMGGDKYSIANIAAYT